MTSILSDLRGAIAYLKSTLDIAQVVSGEIGSPAKESERDKFYLCPFHGEDTPSFSAHQPMQIYHCFGCGVTGDVVHFISNYHGVSSSEAVRFLADKYSVDLSKFERPATPEEIRVARLKKINHAVAEHCSKLLFASEAVLANYKSETWFDDEVIIDYGVGYSSSHVDIVNVAYQAGATEADVNALELYSRLMWDNSIVYPVRGRDGTVHKFHNKPITPPVDFGGKYVGTSASSPLYTHSAIFGAHLINKNNKNKVVLYEGQKAAMAGRGLAILGSSIHKDQISAIQGWGTKTVVFAFDGDAAGQNATDRLFLEQDSFGNLLVLAATIPEGQQPDDIAKLFGRDGLQAIVDAAVTPLEAYVTKRASKELTFTDKQVLLAGIRDQLAKISETSMEMSANYLAGKLGVSADAIKADIHALKTNASGLTNLEAEHSVIKHLVDVPRQWSTVRQSISQAIYFSSEVNRSVYNAVAALNTKYGKLGLSTDDISMQAIVDQMGNSYSAEFAQLVSRSAKYSLQEAIFIVVDLAKRRAGVDQSRELALKLKNIDTPTVEILAEHRKKLVSTLDYRKDTDSSPDSLVTAVERELQARSLIESNIIGHDFSKIIDVDGRTHHCLDALSLVMSGLQNQHQIIIAAQSGVGKSLMGLQMATAISVCPHPEDQVPVLWIPLEMNKIEITMRMISMLTGINNTKVQLGKFSQDEHLKIKKANQKIAQSQFYIHRPNNPNIEELFAVIDEHKFKYDIQVVFLDYLQMVLAGPSDRNAKREEVIGRASKMMKFQVAEDMGIASVCIAQLNRTNYEDGDRGSIQSVGGSYQISQDADDFFIISTKSSDEMANESGLRGNRRAFIDKRRGGASDVIIDMNLDDTKDVSLRFTECVSIEKLTGITGDNK